MTSFLVTVEIPEGSTPEDMKEYLASELNIKTLSMDNPIWANGIRIKGISVEEVDIQGMIDRLSEVLDG